MQTITLTYEDCAVDMRRAIEYEGHKSGNYDALRAIVNDRAKLLEFWQDAIDDINNILDKVVVRITDTTAYSDDADSGEEDLEFGVNVIGGDNVKSDSYAFTLNVRNSATPVLLKNTMQRRVVATMMIMWLRIVSPELLAKYQNEEQRCDNQLTKLVYFREMP
jgi:hypothetical protein